MLLAAPSVQIDWCWLHDMKVSELSDILGVPARLAIVATLARGQQLSFTALGEETGIADGNLHVQTRKLVNAGFLTRERVKGEGRPHTRFAITEFGRLAFRDHVRRLCEATDGPAIVSKPKVEAKPRRRSDPARVW